jgi:hypothetical protein
LDCHSRVYIDLFDGCSGCKYVKSTIMKPVFNLSRSRPRGRHRSRPDRSGTVCPCPTRVDGFRFATRVDSRTVTRRVPSKYRVGVAESPVEITPLSNPCQLLEITPRDHPPSALSRTQLLANCCACIRCARAAAPRAIASSGRAIRSGERPKWRVASAATAAVRALPPRRSIASRSEGLT